MTVAATNYLIVGLGNPGARYERTRHNIGRECVALLAQNLSVTLNKRAHGAVWGSTAGPLPGDGAGPADARRTLTLAYPEAYMNLSGHCVQRLRQALRIDLGHLMIVHDHLDLPLGRVRVRPQGGSGGNNGVKSVIQQLGTNAFPRTAVGIGRPPGRMDPAAYVLRRFPAAEERDTVTPIKCLVAEALVYWVTHGIDATMNRYNGNA